MNFEYKYSCALFKILINSLILIQIGESLEEVWTLPGGFTHSTFLYEDHIFLKLLYLVEKTPENEPLDLQMRKLLEDCDEITKSRMISQNISDRE